MIMMTKHIQRLLIAALLVIPVTAAHSKARFKSEKEMIETADVIAVVKVTSAEKVNVQGKHWTYAQKASASVESTVKGSVKDSLALYGDENFICAQCHFETGRYIVFLDYDGELLTGNNWQFSTVKINDDNTVRWNDQARKPLAEVLESIRKAQDEPKQVTTPDE